MVVLCDMGENTHFMLRFNKAGAATCKSDCTKGIQFNANSYGEAQQVPVQILLDLLGCSICLSQL